MSQEYEHATEHELETTWSLYAHASDNDYQSNIIFIGKVDTIESFWRLYNNIPRLNIMFKSDSTTYCNGRVINGFSFFRNDILPEWEDIHNVDGSEWCWRGTLEEIKLNKIWDELLLRCIGEYFENVNGIRVVYKPKTIKHDMQQKVEIWMPPGVDESKDLRLLNECLIDHYLVFNHVLHTVQKRYLGKKNRPLVKKNIN